MKTKQVLWTLATIFFDLKKTGESPYVSNCPVCKPGLLTMRRDPKTAKLQPDDRCLFCGQAIQYTDIERVQKDLG